MPRREGKAIEKRRKRSKAGARCGDARALRNGTRKDGKSGERERISFKRNANGPNAHKKETMIEE